jgi:hypothetical protein
VPGDLPAVWTTCNEIADGAPVSHDETIRAEHGSTDHEFPLSRRQFCRQGMLLTGGNHHEVYRFICPIDGFYAISDARVGSDLRITAQHCQREKAHR